MTRLVRLLALLVAALSVATSASAHLMPNTAVYLDFGRTTVQAEILIPVGDLQYALDRRIEWRDHRQVQAASDYVASRLHVRGTDGRAWRVVLTEAGTADESWAPDIRTRLRLDPPPGGDTRRFEVAYDAVTDKVPNHFVLLFSRTDYAGGQLGEPQLIGGLQGPGAHALVDRGGGASSRGFAAAVSLGMHHIAEGHDHLLFLIALLLPAPLVARVRRWGGFGGVRHTVRGLAGVVTAFTVGHSLTLIGGAFLGWKLPAQPVEVGIATSILISAIHAWRPLFAGREPLIAGLFGLVHGLAFATIIGHFGLEPLEKAQAILGFNLGIELVQLMVVAATMPALVMLAKTRFYAPFRDLGAAFAGIAACAWIVERVAGVDNPVGRVIDEGLAHAPWLLLALTLGAGAALLAQRRERPAAV